MRRFVFVSSFVVLQEKGIVFCSICVHHVHYVRGFSAGVFNFLLLLFVCFCIFVLTFNAFYLHVHMYVHNVYEWMYICMYICIYVCMDMCRYVRTYIYTYVNIKKKIFDLCTYICTVHVYIMYYAIYYPNPNMKNHSEIVGIFQQHPTTKQQKSIALPWPSSPNRYLQQIHTHILANEYEFGERFM